jgi:hypothetical protein
MEGIVGLMNIVKLLNDFLNYMGFFIEELDIRKFLVKAN